MPEQTAREEARLKGLLAKQAISQKEYDDAASANAIAQATLQTAKLNLSWTTVTAPVAGTSGRANKSEGNLITTADATALTSIYQSNPIWARFGLSESDTAALPGGQLKADEIRTVELILPNEKSVREAGQDQFPGLDNRSHVKLNNSALNSTTRTTKVARTHSLCARPPAYWRAPGGLSGPAGCRVANGTGPHGDGRRCGQQSRAETRRRLNGAARIGSSRKACSPATRSSSITS